MIERRIAANTIFLFLRMVLVMGVSLYTSRIVLKELGATDYGIYSVVAGVVSMISFLNTSLSNGYQRYFNISLGQGNTHEFQICFYSAILIQLIVIALTILVCESLGLWFLNNEMTIPSDRLFAANWIYQTSILVFCFNLIRVPFHAVIISFEKMNVFAYLSVIEVILQLIMVYLLSFQDGDCLIAYGNLMGLLSLGMMISYIIIAKKVTSIFYLKIKFHKVLIIKILSFSGWNLFGSFAYIIRTNGINILLNLFFNPIINTANGFASQVSNALSSLSQNIVVASRPQIIKNYAQGNHLKMMETTYSMSRYVFCLLWILSFPIIQNIDYIYNLWLGNNTPEYTEIFTVLVLIYNLVDAFSSSLATLIHATGKMKRFQVFVSLTIISIIPISYFLLYFGFPPDSVFYANIFVAIISQIVRIIIVKQVLPSFNIHLFVKNVIFHSTLVILSTCLILYPIDKYIFANLHGFQTLSISFFITLIIVFLTGLTPEERQIILNKFIKIKQQ